MASSTGQNSVAEAPGQSHNLELHQDHHRSETGATAAQHHPLAKQWSLLSFKLDEIQTTVCEHGKSFGSMNIDEFLANIWTVEKGGADGVGTISNDVLPGVPTAAAGGGSPPASLRREGSLSIPAPLCRKTVDAVCSDIHREEKQAPQGRMQPQQRQDLGSAPRHPTLGEMTLEDFLVKAGVVRESGYLPCSSPLPLNQLPLQSQQLQQQNRHGLSDGYPGAGYGVPEVGVGYGDHQNHPTTTANGVYHTYPHQKKVLRGKDQVGVGSPVSPLSSDGFGGGQVASSNPRDKQWGESKRDNDSGAGAAGASGGDAPSGGRKRIFDGGPVEKVVERRQRRMMKNRESAARSRARRQAYTVELEQELNFLKEENARLVEEQQRMAARRRQMLLESMAKQSEVNSLRNAKVLRQCCSCVW